MTAATLGAYASYLGVLCVIYVLVALSLNLMLGYCGLLSLAHAGFFALGCYTYAICSMRLHWDTGPTCLLALAVGALSSLLLSVPSRRFRHDHFAIISIAVQMLIYSVLLNWADASAPMGTLRNLTNGPLGIAGIPRPVLFGHSITRPGELATFALLVCVTAIVFCSLLQHSPWGRLLKAIRDDELAAQTLGKRIDQAKAQVCAIACSLASIAGALYAAHIGFIDPDSTASLDGSLLMLSMVVIGGMGNLRGPILGAAVVAVLPEALRFTALPEATAASIRYMAYGLALVAMLHFRPQGLFGDYRLE